MKTSEEILGHVREVMGELFEVEPEIITPQSRLYEDLGIDSIDAVDLIDRIRRYTGKRVSAEDFRSVRTIADLVSVVQRITAD